MIIGDAREGKGCLHLDGLETGTRSLIDLDAGKPSIISPWAQEKDQYLLAKYFVASLNGRPPGLT
jgi:hypothetical protein